MWKSCILLSAVLAGGTLLCSCGKSVEPPPRSTLVEGRGPVAAPIAPSEPDEGILQDPTQYQPAAFTPPPSKAKEAGAAAEKNAADATAAQRKLVLDLLDNLRTGKADLVLEAIDPEQSELLREDSAPLAKTQEAIAALLEKIGPEATEQSIETFKAMAAESLQFESDGPDAATVTPNPLMVILGPEVSAPAGKLVRTGGKWRFRLEAPLTAEDIAKIAAYHKTLQEALSRVSLLLDQKEGLDQQAIMAAFAQLGAAAEGSAANSQPASGPAPMQAPKTGGGRPAKGEQPAP
jgi:hypothetical protein